MTGNSLRNKILKCSHEVTGHFVFLTLSVESSGHSRCSHRLEMRDMGRYFDFRIHFKVSDVDVGI